MCGIAASFAYHYASPEVDVDAVHARLEAMRARGPDDSGVWRGHRGRIVLGHRRLSVIDLNPRAAQPMRSEDGTLVVSYNGEIYNYRELRNDLRRRGCRFQTESDTEVLLHLYRQYGIGMLKRLRGMFAMTLWDADAEQLWLARDPYGIKPLYFRDDGWRVDAASSVRALKLGNPPAALDVAGVASFYLFGSIVEPRTLYQEFQAVPAGHAICFRATGMREPVAFADVAGAITNDHASQIDAPVMAAARIRSALGNSVAAHLQADVPIVVFLSAGLDSAALAALAREHSEPLRTLTLRFEEQTGSINDEGPLAREVAGHLGLPHQELTVTATDFSNHVESVFESMDQPSLDGFNTWFVARAARELGYKVALSGIGGDELFGGYPSFRDIPRWRRFGTVMRCFPGLGRVSRQLATALGLQRHWSPKVVSAAELCQHWGMAYLLRRGVFMPWELPRLMGRERAREGLRRLQLRRLFADSENSTGSGFQKVAQMESCFYLRNQLLRDADWAGMAHGVEIRTPFVDRQLLDDLASTRALRGRYGKSLLVHALDDVLPDGIKSREKTGFTPPMQAWLNAWDSRSSADMTRSHWSRRFVVDVGQRFALP